MIVTPLKKKRVLRLKKKNTFAKKPTHVFKKKRPLIKRWQKRTLWPARTIRRRSWRFLKSSNRIHFFLSSRRKRSFFHRFLGQKVIRTVQQNFIPMRWSKRPFHKKRFKRALYKVVKFRQLWKKATSSGKRFYKIRLKRRFGRFKHRFNLLRRLKATKTRFFQKNYRRRFVKKLFRRRKITRKFRFRPARRTLTGYLNRRSRRLVSSWRASRPSTIGFQKPFLTKTYTKNPLNHSKKALWVYPKASKNPSQTSYYIFKAKFYNLLHYLDNQAVFKPTLNFYLYYVLISPNSILKSLVKLPIPNLNLVAVLQPWTYLSTGAIYFTTKTFSKKHTLNSLLFHSKVRQRTLVEFGSVSIQTLSNSNPPKKGLDSENPQGRSELGPPKATLNSRKPMKRRRGWRRTRYFTKFTNWSRGWRLSLKSNLGLSVGTKFAFLNKCNRFFIKSLKLKLSFYRISLAEFSSSYMIRLLPKHFMWRTNLWQFNFNNQTYGLKLEGGTNPSTLELMKPNLSPSHLKKRPVSSRNPLNLLSCFQNSLFLGGLWNRRFKRFSRRHRRRRVVRFFCKTLLRYPSNSPQPRLDDLSSYNNTFKPSPLFVDTNPQTLTHVLADPSKAVPVLRLPTFVIRYLTLSRLSTSPESFSWVSQIFNPWAASLSLHFLTELNLSYTSSNLFPKVHFRKTLNRKLLKLFKFHRFSKNVTMWYHNMLIRFLENCTGRKVYIKFNPFLENYVSFSDSARCAVWLGRIRSFQRILGPKIFLHESLKILCVSIRSKDPTLLASWLRGMLYRISFWKYRIIFRYLKFLLRYLFSPQFAAFGFRGFKLRLKGKISVAGNARTRTLQYSVGETSYSKFDHRVASDFNTINTFTGVLGFRMWFFF